MHAPQVMEALYAGVHDNAASNYLAFYSSELGGIVTDPALMVVSMDDHLVHRGHAVFDTATLTQVRDLRDGGAIPWQCAAAASTPEHATCGIMQGFLYQLDDHLDRFYRSAAKAGLTPPYERPQLRRIILDTAAASRQLEGVCPAKSVLCFAHSQPCLIM